MLILESHRSQITDHIGRHSYLAQRKAKVVDRPMRRETFGDGAVSMYNEEGG